MCRCEGAYGKGFVQFVSLPFVLRGPSASLLKRNLVMTTLSGCESGVWKASIGILLYMCVYRRGTFSLKVIIVTNSLKVVIRRHYLNCGRAVNLDVKHFISFPRVRKPCCLTKSNSHSVTPFCFLLLFGRTHRRAVVHQIKEDVSFHCCILHLTLPPIVFLLSLFCISWPLTLAETRKQREDAAECSPGFCSSYKKTAAAAMSVTAFLGYYVITHKHGRLQISLQWLGKALLQSWFGNVRVS